MSKEEEYRIEVIMSIRNLERLDKDIFTEEERQEAQVQLFIYFIYYEYFPVSQFSSSWSFG